MAEADKVNNLDGNEVQINRGVADRYERPREGIPDRWKVVIICVPFLGLPIIGSGIKLVQIIAGQ